MSRRRRSDFSIQPEIASEKKHINMLVQAARAVERDVDRLLAEKTRSETIKREESRRGRLQQEMLQRGRLWRGGAQQGGETKRSGGERRESGSDSGADSRSQNPRRFRQASSGREEIASDEWFESDDGTLDPLNEEPRRFRQASSGREEIVDRE